jgi:uncharacterized membrane protein
MREAGEQQERAVSQNPAAAKIDSPRTLAEIIEQQAPGALQGLPSELKEIFRIVRLETSVTYSGPLPAPWALAEYCKYIPDAGERMMAMAEKQSAHRIELEKILAPRQVIESGRGQIWAGVLSLAALGLTGWLGYLHETTAACTVGGATVVTLAATFIGGKTAIIKNLFEKQSAPASTATPAVPQVPKRQLSEQRESPLRERSAPD